METLVRETRGYCRGLGGDEALETHLKIEYDPGCQTSDGSFSAVSTATIASKDAFCSIFRDLQDLHSFAPLQSQILLIFRNFFRENFRIVSDFLQIFAEI